LASFSVLGCTDQFADDSAPRAGPASSNIGSAETEAPLTDEEVDQMIDTMSLGQ